jgi:hypothetical protein
MENDNTGGKTLMKAGAAWRVLSPSDIESLVRVADKIHPDLPESD